jgi:dienelactone hydrolase
MKAGNHILTVLIIVCGCTASAAAPEDNGPHAFTRHSESIPARDGEEIPALVYRTDAPGERSLIIFRHGFSRRKESLEACGEHWASRGFTVILNNSRTGLRPDYKGRDSDDMIDCADWAVRKSAVPGHYLHDGVNKQAVIIGGYSAGGYTALNAVHKNHTQSEGDFTCAVMVLFDPYPTDADHAAALAREIHVPSIMLHADNGICNGRGRGKVIFKNTAGPTYALHIKGASHCDFEPQSSLGCALMCMGGWNSERNAAITRYATAMIEAYAGGDSEAYSYINGTMAQADKRITIYPESRGLVLPPAPTMSFSKQEHSDVESVRSKPD